MSFRKLSMGLVLGATLMAMGCEGAGDAGDLAAPRFGEWGVDLAGMNRDLRPGEDFFQFAVGRAWDAIEIPADRSGWGAFQELDQLSEDRSRLIIENAAEGGGEGEAAQVGGLYASFMDTRAVQAADAEPLAADLQRITGADTRTEMAALMGEFGKSFHASLFAPFVYDDQKAPDTHTVYLNLADLTLPDRDYYLEPAFAAEKEAFQAYVARVLDMIGWADPDAAAQDIVAFETAVAREQWTRAERRDDEKMYNPRSVAEIRSLAPGFDWDAFFAAADLGAVDRFVLGEVTAFPDVARIFAETDLETLQAWQAFRTADAASPYLSDRFYDSYFDFHSKTLSGIEEQRERWKRGVELVENAMGEAVGRLYVEDYFPASSKAQMEALVADLKTAMGQRIAAADWMGEATKAEAQRKLEAMRVKIGYPDKWRDYSGLQIDPEDLYGNVKRAFEFEWDYRVGKLGQPVDDEEWAMTPQTVNAYYNSTKNEIVFPAAILQPPFFDPQADPAVNYGAIGAVIGHEITHGFDDQGRKSDADGFLRDWWTAEDGERFVARARVLGDQYARYEPAPGLFINPDLTMGENIADVGGLIIAHEAYRASLGGEEAPVIDGLTGDQRFFLAFAQVWNSKYREDAIRQRLVSDSHSPNIYRVNGVVPNLDAFYAAFDIRPSDPMYIAPEDRARIW